MKVKLIKKKDGRYNLYDGEIGIGSTYDDLQGYKLSLKNCQEIESGYDLDELLNDYGIRRPFMRIDKKHQKMYKEGFQKALELMGDKKFTLEDMMNCWNKALKFQEHKETLGEHIQSLQQKEWDVIIEMEPYHNGDFINDGKTHIIETKLRPRLDSDGCLILKKL